MQNKGTKNPEGEKRKDIIIQFQDYISKVKMRRILNASEKELGYGGTMGAAVASFFFSPDKFKWVGPVAIAGIMGTFMLAQSRWVQSQPDEWLIIVRNGEMLRGGIGMKTFIGFTDTVVRFPSRLQRVNFTANNVTKQMQGVEIEGVAFWSVYREEDGPFRCYKYMQGNNANQSVGAMCESVLRSLIANSTLDDVLRKRNYLRDDIKTQLKGQFKRWGIWLETIEITEVKISSTRLFNDLQAEFRQSTHLKAEQIQLLNKEKIAETKQTSEIKMSQLNESIRTKKQQTKNTEVLKRKQMDADFQRKKNELEVKKMEREKLLDLERYRNDHQLNQLKLQNEQELEKMKKDFQKEHLKKAFEVDKYHDDLTLAKYQIDSLEKIYKNLGTRNISIHQFAGGDKDSMAAIMPNLAYGMAQIKQA